MRAQSLILFNLLFYLSSTCSSPLPPRLNHPDLHDWIQPYQSGNLLFAFNLSNDTRLVPSIGNGYLATVFESDTLFISGIYNGNVTEARPSHRARIPGFASMVCKPPTRPVGLVGDGSKPVRDRFRDPSCLEPVSNQSWTRLVSVARVQTETG
jgi:hypothetical protein